MNYRMWIWIPSNPTSSFFFKRGKHWFRQSKLLEIFITYFQVLKAQDKLVITTIKIISITENDLNNRRPSSWTSFSGAPTLSQGIWPSRLSQIICFLPKLGFTTSVKYEQGVMTVSASLLWGLSLARNKLSFYMTIHLWPPQKHGALL